MVPGDPYRQIINQLLNLEPEAEPSSVALDDATLKVAREAARPPWYASGLTGIITIIAPVLLWLDGSFASPRAIVASVLVSIACTAACNAQSQTYAGAAARLTEIRAAAPCSAESKPQDICSRWVAGTVTWGGGIADSPVNSVCEVLLRWDSGQQTGDIRIDSSACPGLSIDTPVPAQIELVKSYAIRIQVGPATYKTDLYPPYGDSVYSIAILLRVATLLWLAWPLLHVVAAVADRIRSKSARRVGTPSPPAAVLGSTK